MQKGDPFVDPGLLSARDGEDGDLLSEVLIDNNVNPDVPGIYRVIYSVVDSDANYATVGRNVTVISAVGEEHGVVASLKVLTRVRGVSPETVYFSAMESSAPSETDLSGGNNALAIAWSKLTYHFSFDDPDSGYFSPTGRSRNHQLSGSPRAIHTFHCNGTIDPNWDAKKGVCVFDVAVRVKDSLGNFDDAETRIEIQTQDDYYSASDTICVSATENWEGCPSGAVHMQDTPDYGSWSGKRVLFQRDSRGAYSNIHIGHGAKNVTVDTYGNGSRPLIYAVEVGSNLVKNNAVAELYEPFTRDADGYVTAGWAYNITVTGLRVGKLSGGHALTLVTLTDLDADWSDEPNDSKYGKIYFSSQANNCTNEKDFPDLDCDRIHYPYGVFITDSVIKANLSSLPTINIGCFNGCAIVNSGMAGVEVKNAREHNSRVMGSWGLVVTDSWFRGNHIGGSGAKGKLTVRVPGSEGTAHLLSLEADPEDYQANGHVRGATFEDIYLPRYASIINNWFNDDDQDPNSVAGAFVGIDRYYKYSLVYGNDIFTDPVNLEKPSFNVIGLQGEHNFSMHNKVPPEFGPCATASDFVENYHDASLNYAIAESWDGYDEATGTQCRRWVLPVVVPGPPGHSASE
ncbi:immunoglobulin-like domain-containing protein [Teredinibacter turnerae]|uniref:immunoglobulin-like domain-containing protein n=1 Tax=Teredinibacter turnerae TaxID=2426 RepID=UPI0003782E0E|nr:immunoglobulin-like domain-containing protein [Teredinibacter turnerae]